MLRIGFGMSAFVAASFAVSSPASAQGPQASASEPVLNEIIVTARRTAERLQSVPVAVTALDSNYLREHTIHQVSDLNYHVPSLQINGISSPEQFQLSIRGQRNAEYGPGEDPAVGTYFAEVPYNLAVGVSQQLFDLQSVQVLKGPQGTLFGLSTPGGAILISPQKPVSKFESSLVIGTTIFGHGIGGYGTGVINAPIVPDRLLVRAAFNFVQRDGYVADEGPVPSIIKTPFAADHLQRLGLNDEHTRNFRLSVLARPSDEIENDTVISVGRMRNNGSALQVTALNPKGFVALVFKQAPAVFADLQKMYEKDFWTTQNSVQQNIDINTFGVANSTTIDVNKDITITNVAGYRTFNAKRYWDLGGMPLPVLNVPSPYSGKEYSEELRVHGSIADGALTFTSGVFYFVQDADIVYGASVLGGVPNDHLVSARSESLAGFTQADVRTPIQGLTLTLGVRYTDDKRRMRIDGYSPSLNACILTSKAGRVPLSACQVSGSSTYTTPTWTVSLNYQPEPDTLVYLASRRGYRAGSWPGKVTNVDTFLPIRPEKVTDVELGFKRDWTFGNSRLRTNAAAYYQDYTDIQRPVNIENNGVPAVILFNAAGAHISGAELEATMVPIKGLELTGSFSYLHAIYTKFLNLGADYTNNEFANTPKFQFTLGARYTSDLPGNLGSISVGGDFFHQSHVFFTDTQQAAIDGPYDSRGQDAYGLVNFRVDWNEINGSRIGASVYVTNAFARKYHVSYQEQLYATLGFNAAGVGDPRVVGLELRAGF